MRKACFFVMLIAMLVLPGTTEAKNRDKAWEFGAMIGYMDQDEVIEPNLEGADNSEAYGIRFGYHFSASIEAEIVLDVQQTELFGDVDTDFVRAAAAITGNFLTDRETATIPYITVGLGVINQTVDEFEFIPTTGPMVPERVPEQFDSGALLTIGVGARTFFGDVFGIRYEVRYIHHDTFEENQDEFFAGAGVTFVLGGEG